MKPPKSFPLKVFAIPSCDFVPSAPRRLPVHISFVASFSVYIDTLLVCSATGFMLLITGKYNVENPVLGANGATEFLYEGAQNVTAGTGFTQSAMNSVFPGFGSLFVAIVLFFFAFTTILAYYYIAETNISYLTRKINSPIFNRVLKIVMIVVVMYGCVNEAKLIWNIGDIGVGIMAWCNIIAILLLQKPAFAALKDYEKQKKEGQNPVFHPKNIGVMNAPIWDEINKNREV